MAQLKSWVYITVFSEPNTSIDIDVYKVNFQLLPKPSFSVEPTAITELGQQKNQLLSQLHMEFGQTTFGIWANNNPNFWVNYRFGCVY